MPRLSTSTSRMYIEIKGPVVVVVVVVVAVVVLAAVMVVAEVLAVIVDEVLHPLARLYTP